MEKNDGVKQKNDLEEGLSKEDVALLLRFLERVELRGVEVPTFVSLVNKLKDL